MQRHRWALLPAFGVAALSALLLASPADAQWRDDGRGRAPYGSGRYNNAGYSQGFEDGYDKGRDDARDRDRYDLRRHSRYRSADHGYNRRYGPKEYYQRVYRDGFQAGYDQGYRENSRGRRGNPNRGPWWPRY